MSQYTPPYSNKNSNPFDEESKSPFKRTDPFKDNNTFGANSMNGGVGAEERVEKQEKTGFLSLLFLCAGVNVATVGLLQLFFSENGVLHLEWNSSYWFIYTLLGIPLAYLGFKKLSDS